MQYRYKLKKLPELKNVNSQIVSGVKLTKNCWKTCSEPLDLDNLDVYIDQEVVYEDKDYQNMKKEELVELLEVNQEETENLNKMTKKELIGLLLNE